MVATASQIAAGKAIRKANRTGVNPWKKGSQMFDFFERTRKIKKKRSK